MLIMQDNQPVAVVDNLEDDEIDISGMIITIWKNKITLLYSTICFLIIAITYLHLATYSYTAEIKIFPAQGSGGGGGSQLSGLASLAGISLPDNKQAAPFELYNEEIYSREVADALSLQMDLMKTIYKGEWDAKNARWRKPVGFLTPVIGAVKAVIGIPVIAWQAPNGRRLQDYIKDKIVYEKRQEKPTATMSFSNKDPVFAVQFLNALYKAADDKLRQKALERSTKYIGYLSEKLKTTSVTDYRSALVSILSDQEKLSMIASSDLPYAAESLGGAMVSLKPTKPNPRGILMLAILAGLVAGSLLILVRHYVMGASSSLKPGNEDGMPS